MARKNTRTRQTCAADGCDNVQRRKFCPAHSASAPMRTLAREGRWAELQPQAQKTARPQARKVAKSQVKQASAKARTRAQKRAARAGAAPAQVARATRRDTGREVLVGKARYALVDGQLYRIAS